MKQKSIFDILKGIDNQIEHQMTESMRAHDLLELLRFEQNKLNDTVAADLLTATLFACERKSFERIHAEIIYAIDIVSHFYTNQDWDFKFDKLKYKVLEDSDFYTVLSEIRLIINKYNDRINSNDGNFF